MSDAPKNPVRAGESGAELLRLFFAFWPDDRIRGELTAAAQAIAEPSTGSPVAPESYHLTVAFVGAVPLAGLARLRQLGASLREKRCAIEFDHYEYWPKPQVVVASARAIPAPLTAVWSALHERISDLGHRLDPKRLRPHVTLARKVTQAPVATALSPIEWDLNELCLVRSDTCQAPGTYTVVDRWPLLDENPKPSKTQ